jgi:hypothetical protein
MKVSGWACETARLVGPEDLEEGPATSATGVSGHDAVGRLLLLAHANQT